MLEVGNNEGIRAFSFVSFFTSVHLVNYLSFFHFFLLNVNLARTLVFDGIEEMKDLAVDDQMFALLVKSKTKFLMDLLKL